MTHDPSPITIAPGAAGGTSMAQHQRAAFTNETVVLDGNDCRWTFEGPAGLTVNLMTALYQAGVTDLIDQTFENIRRGSHRQTEAPPGG